MTVTEVEQEASDYLGVNEDIIGQCAVAFVAYLGKKAKQINGGYGSLVVDDDVIKNFLVAYITAKAEDFAANPGKGFAQGYKPIYE